MLKTALVASVMVALPVSAATQTARITEETRVLTTYPFSEPNAVPILTRDARLYPYHSFEGYAVDGAPRAWRIVRQIEPAFIVITRLNEAEPAVQAMERGVWGFLVKRRTSDYPRIVVDTIRHAWTALRAWKAMVCELREDVIAESKQMKEVMREAETAAMSDSHSLP